MQRTVLYIVAFIAMTATAHAAQPPAPPAAPPPTAKSAAPFDLVGRWEAVITEDWRWRMIVPKVGDATSVPLNEAGLKLTKEWDAAKDAAAGNQCKAFGAGGIMRLPIRLRISWADDQTLKIETDAGQQTRSFVFARSPAAAPARGAPGGPVFLPPLQPGPASTPSLQGTTVARWNVSALDAVTNNTSGGYLRRNGVPYSANALIREYWNISTDFGREYLTVTTVVEDPTYLRQSFITSSHFKKLTDNSPWAPFPCDQL